MEQAVEDIENKMKKTDERLDTLAIQVGNIEQEIFSDGTQEVEVHNLLRSVSEVKDNYQNLRKEIMEVQDLQKQLSSSLSMQLKIMQSKFNTLKEKEHFWRRTNNLIVLLILVKS
ncbi:hypothetical protein GWI33_003232 [Rhynchophorus ferrugineus]|uniref:Ska2 N-terminal domain-containing protein n=1 Tax=Rhynchophorus ferrugineus TaxID=354439 RepID=A0A834IY10_RHYFE|nr:hypothetical protein GWI33_003232 [Rhynchophorus ferrugineus]